MSSRPIAYALVVAIVILGSLLFKQRVDGVFACGAAGYRGDVYLSDCAAPAYGDYDHGAFWFALEPRAAAAAVDASVLFIGNSRLQFAMSVPSANAWFTEAGIRHYLLGFSNSETTVFVGPLLRRLGVRPRAVVLNVDRFFDDRVSPPAEQILKLRDIEARYREKKTWQALHKFVCGAVSMACGDGTAVFRERNTGVWHLTGRLPGQPASTSDGPSAGAERWPTYAAIAERFISGLGVERRCIVLTLVPTVATKRAEAESIAAALGMPLVAPRIEGLRTFDGSHLDAESAERWSRAFLQNAGSRLRECSAAGRLGG